MKIQRSVKIRIVVWREARALHRELEVIVEDLGITPAAVIDNDPGPVREVLAEIVGDDSSLIISRNRHCDEDHTDHGAEEPDGYQSHNKCRNDCTSSFQVILR